MKTLRTYIAILTLAMAGVLTSVNAQVLRDASGDNVVGRIAGNGIVRDSAMHSIGRFDADGTVRDARGTALGKIVRMEIYDTEGERIGYINNDGTVRDGNSNKLGFIGLSDGKVTDAAHNILGYARGIRVDWIACYYFFFFNK